MPSERQMLAEGFTSPAALAASQDFERVSEGVQAIPTGGAGAGVTVVQIAGDRPYDALSERLADPSAVQRSDPMPELNSYVLEKDWWKGQSLPAVESHLKQLPDVVLDHTSAEVVEFISGAHRLHARAVKAHTGDAEAAMAEGYPPPQHDPEVDHAKIVLAMIAAEREGRR